MAGYHLTFNSSSSDDDRPVPWHRNSQLKHYKTKRILSFHTLLTSSIPPSDPMKTVFLSDVSLLQILGDIRRYEGKAEALIGELETWKGETGRNLDVNLSVYCEALDCYRPGYCLLDWLWCQIRRRFHSFPLDFFTAPQSGLHLYKRGYSDTIEYLKREFVGYSPLGFFGEVDAAIMYPERQSWDIEKYSSSPVLYMVCLSEMGLHSPGDVFEADLSTVLIRFLVSLDFTYLGKASKVFAKNPNCSSPGCSLLRKLKYMLTVKGYEVDYLNPLEGSALHVFMRKLGDAIQAKKTHKFYELYSLVLALFRKRYAHFHIRYREKTPLEEFQEECSATEVSAVETVYRAEGRKVDILKLLWVYSKAMQPPLPLSLIRDLISLC